MRSDMRGNGLYSLLASRKESWFLVPLRDASCAVIRLSGNSTVKVPQFIYAGLIGIQESGLVIVSKHWH